MRKSQFCLSSFLSSFSFSDKHSSKTIRCVRIVYIPNDCSTTGHLPFQVWGGVQATTGELQPRNGPPACKTLVFINFCGFCLRIPGVACIVSWLHPDHWTCALQWAMSLLPGNCQNQKLDYSFLYLLDAEDHLNAMEDVVVHLDTFGSPQRDSTFVWRWVVVTSDHIELSFVWK